MSNLKSKSLDKLFDAVLGLESVEDCYAFFIDLCTVDELKAFGQRYDIAQMLYDNTTYNAITSQTGVSTATISRINRFLRYGEGGYLKALDKQNKK